MVETSQVVSSSASVNSKQLFSIFLLSALVIAFFMIILQQIGTPPDFLVYLSFTFLAFTYLIVAILSRTMNIFSFQLGTKSAVPRFVGMGIAAATISGGVFIGQAGEIFATGQRGFLGLLAIFLGLGMAAVLFAPMIARSKAVTLADFIAGKSDGKLTRLVTMICVVLVSLALLVSQLSLVRSLTEAFFEISGDVVVQMGLLVVVICMLAGGMRALTWIRAGQYVVLASSFLIPLIWISVSETGFAIPHLSYGFGALDFLADLNLRFSSAGTEFTVGMQPDLINVPGFIEPQSIWMDCLLIFAIGCCIASMPHMLQHFSTVPGAREARASGAWAIGLTVLVLGAAPAYAAFIKAILLASLPGIQVLEIGDIAPWILEYSTFEGQTLAAICGSAVDTVEAAIAACGQGGTYRLTPSDIFISPNMITMGSAAITDLPPLFSIFLGVGALAAIFATVDGLLLVSGNTIAHDGIFKSFSGARATGPRIFASRFWLIIVAVTALVIAYYLPVPPLEFAAMALAISGATLFAPMVLRCYLPSATYAAVALGMIMGLVLALLHIYTAHFGPDLKIASGDEVALVQSLFIETYAIFTATVIGILGSGAVTIIVSVLSGTSRSGKPSDDGLPAKDKPESAPDIAQNV